MSQNVVFSDPAAVSRPIPTYFISGFLGSGKTTLLIELLRFARGRGRKVAVLMNEFGDISIDGELLSGEGFSVLELSDGCICCQIGEDLIQAFTEVASRGPEMIFVEATGLADPVDMIDQATMPHLLPLVTVEKMVTVADPRNFPRLSQVLKAVVKRQTQFADIVLIGKADEAKPEQIEEITRYVAANNPHASVLLGTMGRVAGDDEFRWLFAEGGNETREASRAAMRKAVESEGADEYRAHATFHTFSSRLVRPLDRAKFETFMRTLPPEVLRAKGFLTLADDGGLWVAMFVNGDFYLRQAKLSPAPEAHMVFIGTMLDHAQLAAGLTACEVGRRALTLAQQ